MDTFSSPVLLQVLSSQFLAPIYFQCSDWALFYQFYVFYIFDISVLYEFYEILYA